MCVCVHAVCVCARARAGVRACAGASARVCVCVWLRSYFSLSLSLSPWSPRTCDCNPKSNPPKRQVTSCVNHYHSNVTGGCRKDSRGGSHRWRLHRKGGLGPVGVGTVGQRIRDSLPIDQLQTGPSSPPSCPLGKPEGVLEGGDSGPGGSARLRPGSRGGTSRTRLHASKACHPTRFTPQIPQVRPGSVPDLSPPRLGRRRRSGSETRASRV